MGINENELKMAINAILIALQAINAKFKNEVVTTQIEHIEEHLLKI